MKGGKRWYFGVAIYYILYLHYLFQGNLNTAGYVCQGNYSMNRECVYQSKNLRCDQGIYVPVRESSIQSLFKRLRLQQLQVPQHRLKKKNKIAQGSTAQVWAGRMVCGSTDLKRGWCHEKQRFMMRPWRMSATIFLLWCCWLVCLMIRIRYYWLAWITA